MVSILKIEDDDDLKNAVDTADAYLRSGGVIIYPTDTVYGIGCDANSKDALAKVHKIQGHREGEVLFGHDVWFRHDRGVLRDWRGG